MELAGVDFGILSPDKLLHGALATVLYFLVGVAVLAVGFVLIDVLTPGSLRPEVFVERNPNAVVIALANYAAIAAVVISGHPQQFRRVGPGAARCGGLRADRRCAARRGNGRAGARGLGRFRDHIEDTVLHPAVFAAAAILLAVGGINAAALT